MKRYSILPIFLITLIVGGVARADVRLPGFFGDHMVLQQQAPIRVWGWADSGESVEVTLGDHAASVTANDAGRWNVELPPMQASKDAHVLRVKGHNTVEVNDVLVGEVWLCSGQSNMEWSVQQSNNAADEIAAANFPHIRHLKIAHRPSPVPLDDVNAQWQLCSRETVGNFTAAGYFMARHLYQELDVPIGLINSSWGGTRVEPWTPPSGFAKVEALKDIHRSVIGRTPGTDPYQEQLEKHIEATQKWIATAQEALKSHEILTPSPPHPDGIQPFKSHQDPTMLYNGMIHALVGYPIRGVIWYQGESNHAEGMLYFEKKKALIEGWRDLWGQGDFPFYYVQIAPYQYGDEDPTILAKFWEAQAAVQQIPNTGMIVINDIATLDNIHPPNKQEVGRRLALLALKNDYGRDDVVANSPELESLEVLDDSLKVKFRNTGGGLKTRDGNSPTHFEVIGPGSRGFQPARASIQGDAVILSSDSVSSPVAFRFAWHKLAEPNLVGATGLPVGALRGGEEPNFLSLLAIEADYQLVYDLNLAKLGQKIVYDVDNSDNLNGFDRIGYLLELDSQAGGNQKVFVSVNAFTDDAKKIGIPTAQSKARFQQTLDGMKVVSTVDALNTSDMVDTGNIEFWPNNYAPGNGGGVLGASGTVYDFGDDPGPPEDGYGSMQIHNFAAKQTVFAVNHWSAGAGADIGIGNSPADNSDWTFSGNAASYTAKRLRIYVRPTAR